MPGLRSYATGSTSRSLPDFKEIRVLISKSLLVLILFVGLAPADAGADALAVRTGLKLVFEIRDLIHRHYVETVDSARVVDAALDGLVAALPEGENVYISPREMATLGSDLPLPPAPRLHDREQLQLISEVFRRVTRDYLRPVGADTLTRGMIWGMLTALDPHSSYLDPREYAEMAERFRGDFEGIGIYFEVRNGELLVISPIVGSPSYGKLRAGDRIIEIQGVSTDGITNEQVMQKLRGPKGSKVQVTVSRRGRAEPFHVEIQRDRIRIHSIPYIFMLRPGTGYVRIVRFGETTGAELGEALNELREQGMERLLLDLRGNAGGLLSQAVDVADYFVKADDLIVTTRGRDAASRQEYRARRPACLSGAPMVVLIDHGSASASEIVAGALQDLDRALIVGQTSFGKGLVQEQFPLRSNGGLLLLTVARYYTPLGRLIQRPYSDDLQAYYQQGTDDFDPNAVDSLRAGKRVFRTRLGRAVYGGGGITPDQVLESDEFTEFMHRVYASGLVPEFSSRWVGSHPDWPSDFGVYLDGYRVSDEAVHQLTAMLDSAAIPTDPAVLEAHLEFLRRQIKAGIAQVLWGDEQRYRVDVEGSTMVRKALAQFGRAAELVRQRKQAAGTRR